MNEQLIGVIQKPRHRGKTIDLISIAHERKSYIVCINRHEASRVFHEAKKLKMDIPFPITFDEFLKGGYHTQGIGEFLIDNVDMLLQHISKGVPIAAVSLTGHESVSTHKGSDTK